HALRLSTSYLTPTEIDEGITRLAAFIISETEQHTMSSAKQSEFDVAVAGGGPVAGLCPHTVRAEQ
ncbi:hypothetical protein AB0J80_27920, partial [Actinoplanes sp. NPDC049548]|uniref:hypothetical protein n=1 Tax=Actinoplanes sp. NPDC049548 TaxID=3155152 RepID=UPI0034281EF9